MDGAQNRRVASGELERFVADAFAALGVADKARRRPADLHAAVSEQGALVVPLARH